MIKRDHQAVSLWHMVMNSKQCCPTSIPQTLATDTCLQHHQHHSNHSKLHPLVPFIASSPTAPLCVPCALSTNTVQCTELGDQPHSATWNHFKWWECSALQFCSAILLRNLQTNFKQSKTISWNNDKTMLRQWKDNVKTIQESCKDNVYGNKWSVLSSHFSFSLLFVTLLQLGAFWMVVHFECGAFWMAHNILYPQKTLRKSSENVERRLRE